MIREISLMTFEQRLEGSKKVIHEDSWRKNHLTYKLTKSEYAWRGGGAARRLVCLEFVQLVNKMKCERRQYQRGY